ncbi:hypothetical protein MMZ75_32830 (plasmid) [Pseudomonas aeruginosa]|nr:hypothetical protein [Pseudomonas aeruginosa]UTN36198.1 hypothetical protein MMZ75_32830 [Pseudomonas aeruginosa]
MISTAELGSFLVENLWIYAAILLLLLILYVLAVSHGKTTEAAHEWAAKWRSRGEAELAIGNVEAASSCFARAKEWDAEAQRRSLKHERSIR